MSGGRGGRPPAPLPGSHFVALLCRRARVGGGGGTRRRALPSVGLGVGGSSVPRWEMYSLGRHARPLTEINMQMKRFACH